MTYHNQSGQCHRASTGQTTLEVIGSKEQGWVSAGTNLFVRDIWFKPD